MTLCRLQNDDLSLTQLVSQMLLQQCLSFPDDLIPLRRVNILYIIDNFQEREPFFNFIYNR